MPNMDWPPNYSLIFAERAERYKQIFSNPEHIYGAKEYYSTHYLEFIEHWMNTYDPRNSSTDLPTKPPFILFPKQKEFLVFLQDLVSNDVNGIIEKSRDMGATWILCAFSICEWLFQPGVSIGWGSRKEQLVDKIGDPDSIFEKMRMILRTLPVFFLPKGFDVQKHATHMKIINPDTGSTITGEAGDNIGRGGRKKFFVKDEAAHYERPELIEAALADNTNCQIDLSSVNGPANIFARRRLTAEDWRPGAVMDNRKVYAFVMDWRDHPKKDQAWYDARRDRAEREGLMHIFHQEVDRDYSASVEGVLIPKKWIDAAIDAHERLGFEREGIPMAALDVADEGGDRNALSVRHGSIIQRLHIWGAGDTGQTAQKAIAISRMNRCKYFFYDSIGVGAGVKSEANRMMREGNLKRTEIDIIGWNAAAKPLYPKARVVPRDRTSPKNKEFFKNLKSQGWWNLRKRFEKTFKMVQDGVKSSKDEMISIPSRIEYRNELITELSQIQFKPNDNGQIMIQKNPPGTKSPNAADSVMMCFWPIFPPRVMI